jgi:hypothetical protein
MNTGTPQDRAMQTPDHTSAAHNRRASKEEQWRRPKK